MIATLGRPIVIRTLNSLLAAKGFESLEVLLVGRIAPAAVAERIAALVAAYPQIRHLPLAFERGDSSNKKNAGWQQARADIVAFLDDDVVVQADWPSTIIQPFAAAEVGLVSGPGLVPEDVSGAARLAGLALASPAAGYVAQRYLGGAAEPRAVAWSWIIGCNMAYRKSVLEQIQGFDPSFWPGEEMLAAYRAERSGARIIFHPAAAVFHYPRQSLGRFMKQMASYGATRIRLIRAKVQIEPTTLLPALGLLGLLLLLPWAFFYRWPAYLLGGGLALYFILVAILALLKTWAARRWLDLLLLVYIPLMHLSYGLGECYELLRPGRDLSEK